MAAACMVAQKEFIKILREKLTVLQIKNILHLNVHNYIQHIGALMHAYTILAINTCDQRIFNIWHRKKPTTYMFKCV